MKHLQYFKENLQNISFDDIKKFIDNEIFYYDGDNEEQCVDDCLHDIKTHLLKVDLDSKIEREDELIEYIKKSWLENLSY